MGTCKVGSSEDFVIFFIRIGYAQKYNYYTSAHVRRNKINLKVCPEKISVGNQLVGLWKSMAERFPEQPEAAVGRPTDGESWSLTGVSTI